jgi:hypothetical protein
MTTWIFMPSSSLPHLVAREVVVADEVVVDALGLVAADDRLHVLDGAEAGFLTLDVDDRAERAPEGAAAAGIEAGPRSGIARDDLAGQPGNRLSFQSRQVVHVIVEGFQFVVPGVLPQGFDASLDLAGEEADAIGLRFGDLGRGVLEHRHASAHVKPPDADLHAAGEEAAGEVHGAGKLVRLHADQGNEDPAVRALQTGRDLFRHDARVGLVAGFQPNLHIRSERPTLDGVLRNAVDARRPAQCRRCSPSNWTGWKTPSTG